MRGLERVQYVLNGDGRLEQRRLRASIGHRCAESDLRRGVREACRPSRRRRGSSPRPLARSSQETRAGGCAKYGSGGIRMYRSGTRRRRVAGHGRRRPVPATPGAGAAVCQGRESPGVLGL